MSYLSAVGFEGNKIPSTVINGFLSGTEIPPCTSYQNAAWLESPSCGGFTSPWHLNAFTIIYNFLSANVQRIPFRETI